MSHYEHLSTFDREKIDEGLCLRKSLRSIAKEIGRAPSTISRERKRNQETTDHYSGVWATDCYKQRRLRCRKHKKFEDSTLKAKVQKLLRKRWSPEEIENRMKLEKSVEQISGATIYRSIRAGDLDGGLKMKAVKYLRHHGKKRRKKGAIENRGKFKISHTIWERPEEATNRVIPGHWEGDTVIGKQGSACLVTLVDRCAKLLLIGKVPKRRSELVKDKIVAMLSPLRKQYVRSMTLDRGKEFAQHTDISAALEKLPIYFCDPHSPWQRGTNENTNGLLRQYLPKGFDIAKCSEERIERIMMQLNTRPRKCLGWRTPLEAFSGNVLHLI